MIPVSKNDWSESVVRITTLARHLKKKFGYDIKKMDLTHDYKGNPLNGVEEDFSYKRNFVTNLRWGFGDTEVLPRESTEDVTYSTWMKPIIKDIFNLLGEDHPALTADKLGVNVWNDIKSKDD